MDILDRRSDDELYKSILAEVAKATNEVRCAQTDLDKAQNRLSFVVLLMNKLLQRSKGE